MSAYTISSSVTSIGNGVFNWCSSLNSITIPSSVTSIGDDAFRGCESLPNVNIPDGVTSIGVGAFESCTNLTNITIPNSVTSIGAEAFEKCSNLTSITVPNGVTSIGLWTFRECGNLASITIPGSVTRIGQGAFQGCSSLKDVYYPGTKEQWDEIEFHSIVDKESLTSATIHYNSGTSTTTPSPTDPSEPSDPSETPSEQPSPSASNQDTYVDSLIGKNLANADADTRQTVHNAILNLLFKAQYRPTESRIPGDTMSYTGSLDVNKTWPIQNIDYNGPAYDSKTVTDSVLGTIKFAEAGAGCMAYALFATAYTYGTSGNRVECSKLTEDGIKAFIRQYADPGEQLRYSAPHSIVFLGESQDGNGFYYISYNGGVRSSRSTDHSLFVDYQTYTQFTAKVGTSLTVRDTNGGSYLAGTAKSAADVRSGFGVDRIVLRLSSSVGATVKLGGTSLDSHNPGSTSFGKVERVGSEIVFTLDYNPDYILTIDGNDNSSMDVTLEYYAGSSLVNMRKFVGYPVSAATAVQSSRFDPLASFVLYAGDEAWGAGINETTYDSDDDYSSKNNSPDSEVVDPTPTPPIPTTYAVQAFANPTSGGQVRLANASGTSATYKKGDSATVIAEANSGYRFVRWTENGSEASTSATYTFIVKANRTLTALFERTSSGTSSDGGSSSDDSSRPSVKKPSATTSTTPATSSTPITPSTPSIVGGFSDVLTSNTFAAPIAWAQENGIMSGYSDGTFRPSADTNRQQMWMVLARMAGANPANMTGARTWAINSGISDGTNSENVMSRQQLVTMLYRFAQSQGVTISGSADLSAYPDNDAVASYAQEALAWAVGNGIVTGTTDGRLNPEGTATRAHFAAFLYRYGNLAPSAGLDNSEG